MKLVFEVRSVLIGIHDAEIYMVAPRPDGFEGFWEAQDITIRVPKGEDATRWVSRIGKQIRLVPEDL